MLRKKSLRSRLWLPVSFALCFAALLVVTASADHSISPVLPVASLKIGIAAPAVLMPGCTCGVTGTVATFTCDAGSDTIVLDTSGGLLHHNRFTAGDPGFNSDFDFDSSAAGDQTLAPSASLVVNVNAGAGDDSVIIGSASAPASTITGRFNIDGEGGNDSVTWEDSADATGRTINVRGDVFQEVFIPFTGAAVGYGTNVETVTVSAGGGGDTINVIGTSQAARFINAGGGNDNIIFADAATLNGGNIDGGPGIDTLDYSAYTTSVAVNLGLGSTGLSAVLGAEQEVPTTNSSANGTATLTYNVATKTFDIAATINGITPAEVTGFHIHRAPFGVNGPIIVDLLALAPLVPSGGGFTFNATGVALPANNEAAFLGGITYVNVHTAANPGGAIRGQIFSNANLGLSNGTATGANAVANIENAMGGAAGDSIVGSLAANSLIGNDGNDTLVGGPGNDTVSGFANDDIIVWSNGDGSDVMEGGTGVDLVQVNGSVAGGDQFLMQSNGPRISFSRTNLGLFSLDIGTTETLTVNGIGGDDTFTTTNLAGIADLSVLNLNGVDSNDTFNVKASPTATINVNGGLPTTPTGDRLFYDAEGRTFTGDLIPPDGQIVSPGVQNVNFQQLEAASVINAAADLSVIKTGSAGPITAGTNSTYTLTIANGGPGDAQNVTLSDVIPAGTTFVSFSQTTGPAFTLTTPPVGGTGTVLAVISNFANGATATFSLVLNISSSVPNGTVISNTASIASSNTDPNGANNAGTQTTTVNAIADLSITKTDFPDPVAPADDLTYTITLDNAGPSDAQNVQVSDTIPADTTFVSFTAPAGWSVSTPPAGGTGTVTAVRSSFAAGGSTVYTLVVKVNNNPGSATISNTASVSSSTTDPNTGNNSATEVTSLPALFIDDVSVTEGNSGFTSAIFTVTLTAASSQIVTVDFFTANGTATEPSDYTAINGTLTFMPGQLTRTISVPVNGDTVPEGDEAFFVNLTNPSNSPIGDGQGVGTIINDDPGGTLQFSAATYSVSESAGLATITVNRTGSTLGTVTVNFAATNGSATSGQDYGASAGTLTFGPGVTSQTFAVPIIDDSISEGTETVNLALSGPTGGATLGAQNAAVLFIEDNEPPPASSVNVFAVTVNNKLLSFNSAAPDVILSTLPITGLQPGENILVMDFRPANGQPYGLGSSNRLYTIDTSTGAATAVAAPFTPTLSGVDFGGDFNPTVDRLRVVSDLDQNLRLNPATGSVVATDTALNYASGDANFGANPNVVGAAYTNSFAGATTTTLYGIDSNLDTLVLQGSPNGTPVSPNTGQLTTLGALGVNTTGLVGFDIQGSNNRAFASLTSPGDSSSKLYTLSLSTGAASLVGTIGGPDLIRDLAVAAGSIQFSAGTASVSENGGSVTLTVTRTGNTSIPAAVNFTTTDGTATQKGDFTIAVGTLQFAAGETSKTLTIFIIDDAYVEGSENFTVTLSAPTNDFALSSTSTVTVTISDNDSVPPTTNPIDDAQFFVRQHYLDFLNREPDAGGLNFWSGKITACGSDATCINRERLGVSEAFFTSPEFQDTGGFVIRAYQAALNRKPNYLQFMRDRSRLTPANLDADKLAFVNDFVTRAEFTALYASLSNAQYVDALNTNTGNSLTTAQRDALVAGLNAATETRATVLRQVADNTVFRTSNFNSAFVLMEYFGYLRRDIDQGGFDFWLNILNASGNSRGMVCAFLTSAEYQ
ncbi:MAG TPA: DUF4394 domain-containing protein, partial [Pyrinomonadaceae bacterium]|nr:DUF4394 domain-containing protein [Pyrinomonadaceae bacterium]